MNRQEEMKTSQQIELKDYLKRLQKRFHLVLVVFYAYKNLSSRECCEKERYKSFF